MFRLFSLGGAVWGGADAEGLCRPCTMPCLGSAWSGVGQQAPRGSWCWEAHYWVGGLLVKKRISEFSGRFFDLGRFWCRCLASLPLLTHFGSLSSIFTNFPKFWIFLQNLKISQNSEVPKILEFSQSLEKLPKFWKNCKNAGERSKMGQEGWLRPS